MVCFRWSCLYTQKGVKIEKFWPEIENKFKLGKILTYFSHVSAGSPRCGPIKPKVVDPKGHIGRLRAGFPLPQLTSFGALNPCSAITFNCFIFKCCKGFCTIALLKLNIQLPTIIELFNVNVLINIEH